MGDIVAAHAQTRQITETIWYPEHQSRKASAEYHDVHHHLVVELDEACWICGVRNSTLKDPRQNPRGATDMETHHWHVEWALANAIDPARIIADFPQLRTADEVHLRQWLDSEGNMLVLCVVPGTPVLGADGSQRPIEAVRPGECVIGHDGLPHQVTHAIQRSHFGEVILIDGLAVTPEHPLLTPRGWVPAGQLAAGEVTYQLGMFGTQVGGLGRIKPKVFDPVIGAVPVDVMHALPAGEQPPKMLFHHPSVFEPLTPAVIHPHPYLGVPLRGDSPRPRAGAWPRPLVQSSETATVRTEFASRGSRPELGLTVAAHHIGETPSRLSARGATTARAGGVAIGELRHHAELAPTGDTDLHDSGPGLPLRGWWSPIRHIERKLYRGTVHDISVEGCHSYVAAGHAVHNCDVCHRHGLYGIHSITYPAWAAQRWFRTGWDLAKGPAT